MSTQPLTGLDGLDATLVIQIGLGSAVAQCDVAGVTKRVVAGVSRVVRRVVRLVRLVMATGVIGAVARDTGRARDE